MDTFLDLYVEVNILDSITTSDFIKINNVEVFRTLEVLIATIGRHCGFETI
jgi:hypothetical protein